jgi:hypothetical protein
MLILSKTIFLRLSLLCAKIASAFERARILSIPT